MAGQTPMKDRNGAEVTIGARVFVLPQTGIRKGGQAWVRAISGKGHPLGIRARCDDAPQHEEINMNNHTFSAWCKPSEFEILTTP